MALMAGRMLSVKPKVREFDAIAADQVSSRGADDF